MAWSGIEVALTKWTKDDVRAALAEAPPGLCGPDADEERLLAAKPCTTFSELLNQLYPSHSGDLGAAGRLAERLAEPRNWKVKGGEISLDQSQYPPTGHVGVVGNLEISGDLSVVAALVVTGDLIVNGVLSDCGPQSRIVVLGSLRARHVDTGGWVTAVGDIEIEGALRGHHNDDAFESHGTIRAGVIMSDEHGFEAGGGIEPRNRPTKNGVWGAEIFDLRNAAHVTELRNLLGPEALDDDREVDWSKVPRQL